MFREDKNNLSNHTSNSSMINKISFVGSLLVMALAATAPVNAQSIENNPAENDSYSVSPRQLISLARQGRFENQGIPSHDNFRQGVRSGKITAEELVESAIATNRLGEEVKSDRNYVNTVEKHLKFGGCGS